MHACMTITNINEISVIKEGQTNCFGNKEARNSK